jgi:hypothetical protein
MLSAPAAKLACDRPASLVPARVTLPVHTAMRRSFGRPLAFAGVNAMPDARSFASRRVYLARAHAQPHGRSAWLSQQATWRWRARGRWETDKLSLRAVTEPKRCSIISWVLSLLVFLISQHHFQFLASSVQNITSTSFLGSGCTHCSHRDTPKQNQPVRKAFSMPSNLT